MMIMFRSAFFDCFICLRVCMFVDEVKLSSLGWKVELWLE